MNEAPQSSRVAEAEERVSNLEDRLEHSLFMVKMALDMVKGDADLMTACATEMGPEWLKGAGGGLFALRTTEAMLREYLAASA